MTASSSGDASDDIRKTWKPLRFLNLFRLALSGLFVIFYAHGSLPPPLGLSNPQLFHLTNFFYLAFAIVSLLLVNLRQPSFRQQLFLQVIVDIAAITLFMHASGGLGSGLGMLLIVVVANASMITVGRTAGFFAALASIAVLLQQVYVHLNFFDAKISYPQAGLLGAALFATAALAHVLARRARESEIRAEQVEVDLANMAQLTDYVLQRFDTGVLVLDPNGSIRFANQAAKEIFESVELSTIGSIADVDRELAQHFYQWVSRRQQEEAPLRLGPEQEEYVVKFSGIGRYGDLGTLVFLQDAHAMQRQVQQVKLASLGRLTASIAHEIRNPLGAISHATELLQESPQLQDGDQRLTRIVIEQTQRLNNIIENVMQLGRRDQTHPQHIELNQWLDNYLNNLRINAGLAENEVLFQPESLTLDVMADPTHLDQIVSNLVQNSLRFAPPEANPRLEIRADRDSQERPYIDIIDSGPGIDPKQVGQIFEPFFTTDNQGSGLGLFISRELARCNDAQLSYQEECPRGCCFRLTFNDTKPNEPN